VRTLLVSAFLTLPASAQTVGIAPEWETRKMLEALSSQVQRLQPLLEQLKPQDWVSRGAADTYVVQWKSAQAEIGYLVRTAGALAQQPERLPLALETFFRIEAVGNRLGSLANGVRRYQNPALADLLESVGAETMGYREKLRQYLVELAGTKEEELRVMDAEAQRCRGVLTRQAPRTKSEKPAVKKTEPK
jgi:hypothetical protein